MYDTLQTRITLLLSFNPTSTRINVSEKNQSIVRLLLLDLMPESLTRGPRLFLLRDFRKKGCILRFYRQRMVPCCTKNHPICLI